MEATTKPKPWLRANGYAEWADKIEEIEAEWRARGVATRRNWWDVLAGDREGKPCKIAGVEFPVIEFARDRQKKQARPKKSAAGRGPGQRREKKPRAAARRPLPRPAGRPSRGREQGKPFGGNGARRTTPMLLTVKGFAQLEHVEIPAADLVVLVGPQATGKSLVLELLKLAADRNRIVRSLKQHGFRWDSPAEYCSLYFGGGFDKSWTAGTEITYGGERVTLSDVASARALQGEDSVFYIPAHRTLAIADGWPKPFTDYKIETPFVARRFSEVLLTALNLGRVGLSTIFPHERRLKDAFRKLIDDAVFHGAELKLDADGMRKRFVLEYGDHARLPYMAWTAGQREFMPLLLGLYHLLPAGNAPKRKEVQWAVIEEPEMGLHPKAVVAVMAVVLDLLARGYKVALSTHSPTVLEAIWGMNRLKDQPNGPLHLCKMMDLPSGHKVVVDTAARALKCSYAVVHLQHSDEGRVVSTDISRLDPGATGTSEWDWGGLTGFSAKVSEAIAKARSEGR